MKVVSINSKKIISLIIIFFCLVIIFGGIYSGYVIYNIAKYAVNTENYINYDNLSVYGSIDNNTLFYFATASDFDNSSGGYILNYDDESGEYKGELFIPKSSMYDKVNYSKDRIDFFSTRATSIISILPNGKVTKQLYSETLHPELKTQASNSPVNDSYTNGNWRIELLNSGANFMRYIIRNIENAEYNQYFDIEYNGGIYAIYNDILYTLEGKFPTGIDTKTQVTKLLAYDLKTRKIIYSIDQPKSVAEGAGTFLERTGSIFIDEKYILTALGGGKVSIFDRINGNYLVDFRYSDFTNDVNSEEILFLTKQSDNYICFSTYGRIFTFNSLGEKLKIVEVENQSILSSEKYLSLYLASYMANDGESFTIYRKFLNDQYYFHKYTYNLFSGKLEKQVNFKIPNIRISDYQYSAIARFLK